MGSSISCITEIDMANKLLPAAVIASRSKHSATVSYALIFLHGLGDTGYDIYALSENAKQDEAGIKEASLECTFHLFCSYYILNKVGKFVDAEIKSGVPIENIVIGGFSQGGSVALYNALTSTLRYGGVVAFSCWLPLHTKFMSSPTDVPVFQCHGLEDYTIPFAMGKLTHELLKTFQLSRCELNCYPQLSHSSCEKEMGDLRTFLSKNIPGTQ
ncbi:unnamed protein product [Schistosoma margrebowiei]|uniref:palmitoyl-protein hydrolase n=1 Tax=Schistosoma margrebowiei TaxID=48269 RepID=A0A183MHH2_9TREM|nr:unnamed protein product [Schistosoma margrebowiei]